MTLTVAYIFEYCWHAVPGGTAVSSNEVATRLARRPGIELIGVAGKHTGGPPAGFEPPVHPVALPAARPWLYQTWNHLGWPKVERTSGPFDVCHTPYAIPAATAAPHVVTVHDIAFVKHPERFTRHGARTMRRGLERCRNVSHIVCPTSLVAADLLALGFEHDRITVVPWGVDLVAPDAARCRALLADFDLPDRFVLFVGTQEPRKNLARLVEATYNAGMALVVAGMAGWGESTPAASHVTVLGHVDREVLGALYATAEVFAYPSLDEGFGLPVLEAMACGAPVLTSVGIATEEVAGGAAVLVDPHDVDSIADGLTTTIDQRDELIAAGHVRAGSMSWDDTVDLLVEIYQEVAA